MYKVEIFDQSMNFVSVCFTEESTIELDYLAFTPFQLKANIKEAKKGFYAHITEDDKTVADCVISDVKPDDKMQTLSLRPLQAIFDVDVFFNAVTDAITWIATNLDAQFVTNADTLQRRPLHITSTAAGQNLPLTGYNLHPTMNILSVICNAFATWNVVTECSLDLPNKQIDVNIYQQSATKTIECDLENIIEKEVTLGDSYGSTNKLTIKKTLPDGTDPGVTVTYYLHPDGTISTTNNNRVTPVFWSVEVLEQTAEMTDADWNSQALTKAKEALTPAAYDNEVIISVFEDDKLIHPKTIKLGTITTLFLDGQTYKSILTGRKITNNVYTLTFGVVRTELTKKLSIQNRTPASLTKVGDVAVLYGVDASVGECEIGDILIQWGYESITPSAANTPTSQTITFNKSYKKNPFVGVVARSTSIGTTVLGVAVSNTTTTGTNLILTRTNTTSTNVGWVAIGQKA